MKNRVRHSAVLFLSMMLMVALLAGVSPASFAAPLQKSLFAAMNKAAPTSIADKAEAAQAGEEEVPLKDRLLKDELQKDAEAAEADETADAAVAPAAPAAPKISLEDIRRANDPDALIKKYGGYGFDQLVFSDLIEDTDYTFYVTDSQVYYEYPEVSYDYDWDSFDWNSFDWDLIEDWEDWAEFGSPDWDGYDSMDCFDDYTYVPQMGVLTTDQNVYQMDRYTDGTTAFAASWFAFPDDGSAYSNLEDYPLRLLFDSPLLEITDVRTANGLLAVTMAEPSVAFEEDPFFYDGWTFDDDILAAADSWAFQVDWGFDGGDRGMKDCPCGCGGCSGCGCGDAAVNPGPVDAGIENAGVRWVCYLDPTTLEVQYVEVEEVFPDGSILPLSSQTVFYTEPESDLYQAMLKKAAVYEAESFADPRTVTVVYDPGTDREAVVSHACEKGDFLSTTFMEGYLLFEDAKGTVPFLGNSDPNQDLTVYAISESDWDNALDEAWFDAADAPAAAENEGTDALPADALPTDDVLPADALPAEAAADADVEGPFEDGPDAVLPDGPVGVVIVEATADEPGVVVLNPAAEEEEASQEAVILPEAQEEKLDYAEASDRIYEANKLDAIFQNHASVQYCMTFDQDLNPGAPAIVYETPDMAYGENRDAAFYADKASFYQMWIDGSWSDLYYTFDFVNGYDPHLNAGYQIVPETPEEWWNPEKETPVDAWVEGGSVYLKSAYDEDMSRAFVETWTDQPYSGQTVLTLAVADQETYELTSLVYTILDRDGQAAGSPLIYSVDYDLDEPRACRNLRACAERSAELTAELTIIMNPGTDDEVIETMTVPVGSTVIYVSDSEMSLYMDDDCTIPASRWDKLSDMTWYLAP